MANRLIPNTFQHPNDYIDWLSYYLTPQEEKVLTKAIREILGWQDHIVDRRAKISLSVFVKGKKDRNGKQLCMGCGLGISAVRNALAALNEFNILCKVGDPTEDGQEYYLQENWDAIDHEALKDRKDGKKKQNVARTEAAREAMLSDSIEVCCETIHPPVVGQQQRNPNRNTKETQETATGVVVFDGLGSAQRTNNTLPGGYVELQVSNLVDYFYCPECNNKQSWPSSASKRRKATTLICQNRNCGVYFLIENEQTGETYSVPIPEPEWTLRFDSAIGSLKSITMSEAEFKQFQRNWQEDSDLLIDKIRWASTQDWLAHQRSKIAGRVNAAFESGQKTRVKKENVPTLATLIPGINSGYGYLPYSPNDAARLKWLFDNERDLLYTMIQWAVEKVAESTMSEREAVGKALNVIEGKLRARVATTTAPTTAQDLKNRYGLTDEELERARNA